MPPPREAIQFPKIERQLLDPYLSTKSSNPSISNKDDSLHTTLTFATSLDSSLSLSPGTQTHLSGPGSKAMTHFLRSRHDAILIGVGTAIADDPSLNCRLEGVGGYGGEGLTGQPRPVIVDPSLRWDWSIESKVLRLSSEKKGKAPWIISRREPDKGRKEVLEGLGGRYVILKPSEVLRSSDETSLVAWHAILNSLFENGIHSVMIEGGGKVINELLHSRNFNLVNSVIVTIAPTWLGKGGVLVCPDERRKEGMKVPVGRLTDVKWVPLGEDVVLCGRPKIE